MSLEMIYAQKGVAALIAGKLQATKGVPYTVRPVATGFKVEPVAGAALPTVVLDSYPALMAEAAKKKPTITLSDTAKANIAKINAAAAEEAVEQAAKKKPAPQAPKPGTATGDDALAGPIVEENADDQTVILILPYRGESKSYVDAFYSGKPISFGRAQVLAYGVKGVFVEITVSRKYAKTKGFVS